MYNPIQEFNIFSYAGFLKICTSTAILYILLTYSIRFITFKIMILLAPFAFISLINNQFDGFFKGWLKQFIILLSMQIFTALILTLGFCLEFNNNDTLSNLTYFAIIAVIAKCNYSIKEIFSFIYNYSHNKLKDFV